MRPGGDDSPRPGSYFCKKERAMPEPKPSSNLNAPMVYRGAGTSALRGARIARGAARVVRGGASAPRRGESAMSARTRAYSNGSDLQSSANRRRTIESRAYEMMRRAESVNDVERIIGAANREMTSAGVRGAGLTKEKVAQHFRAIRGGSSVTRLRERNKVLRILGYDE